MSELWLPVVGYEGFYEVSNIGRIRSVDRVVPHPHKPLTLKGKLRAASNVLGYKGVILSRDGKNTGHRVHRLVATAFIPHPNSEHLQINHKNGIKNDNRVENLEWVTAQSNSIHAVETGLRRDDSYKRRITVGQAAEIIIRMGEGEDRKVLAQEFNITATYVSLLWKERALRGLKEYDLPPYKTSNPRESKQAK